MDDHRHFHLVITSIEEFALFFALIRGGTLDEEEIQKQIERIKAPRAELKEAVKDNA